MSTRFATNHRPYCVGKWMPSDQAVLRQWLEKIHALAREPRPLLPAVEQLKRLIETDPTAFMLFHQMFDQVPEWRKNDPSGQPQVRDYQHMLELFNVIMTRAPEYSDSGLVGFPFNAILDYSMDTEGGWTAFLNDKINASLRAMLNEWAIYLASAASADVLTRQAPSGWFCDAALAEYRKTLFGLAFEEAFVCDPQAEHFGFRSWDDFFTRRFRPGIRPVADKDDGGVIVNACESTPYNSQEKVQPHDVFWAKKQLYAVNFMLANDPLARNFHNGTIYQAFLSALSYHRWQAPVAGQIVKTQLIPGTYYSEIMTRKPDEAGPNNSQGYISEIATRAVIYIQADDPRIGLMAFVAIGMAEVSTCDIRVYQGQHVDKGDELGMFHFGGSTHCLLFRPQTKLRFEPKVLEEIDDFKHGKNTANIPVCSKIATVVD